MKEFDGSIVAQKAPVVPRARRPGCDARLPLEHLVLPFVKSRMHGAIVLIGPPGSGKTTALRHLCAVLPNNDDTRIGFFDEPNYKHYTAAAKQTLAIVACNESTPSLATFELAPWTIDDCIEYLAGAHRERCSSVMERLHQDAASLAMLAGSPHLLRIVMDRMAADESIATTSDAMRRHLWDLVLPGAPRAAATRVCMKRLEEKWQSAGAVLSGGFDEETVRLLRYRPAQTVLCADGIASALCEGNVPDELRQMLGGNMLAEIAAAVRLRPAAVERLNALIHGPDRRYDAMAASILLEVEPNWRPVSARGLWLTGAMLRGARWSQLDLSDAQLYHANLVGADLRMANLTGVNAPSATFAGAHLRGAMLRGAALSGCDLSGADLSRVTAIGAKLELAELQGANLNSSDLASAALAGTGVQGADFTDADLSRSMIVQVQMNGATWTGARFTRARLDRCHLERMHLPYADFVRADLSGSILTGSRIPSGKFRGANLSDTGLAEIDWEYADLRDVDFSNASFHMGSSRGGLVRSTIPCEGSKTGFYTDDQNEQDFRRPEEIRKANLRGADLSGANVTGTDFYLVDLRDAVYSGEQEEHFSRCGAILHPRVA
ncbi:MAG TPA: pentapeptide repeat-containing protein [Tepidisphaeraceae bacterium]